MEYAWIGREFEVQVIWGFNALLFSLAKVNFFTTVSYLTVIIKDLNRIMSKDNANYEDNYMVRFEKF